MYMLKLSFFTYILFYLYCYSYYYYYYVFLVYSLVGDYESFCLIPCNLCVAKARFRRRTFHAPNLIVVDTAKYRKLI
jgi:hypothetical protein